MKRIKILLSLIFLISLSGCYGEEISRANQDAMKGSYFSPNYAFVTRTKYFSAKETFDFLPIINYVLSFYEFPVIEDEDIEAIEQSYDELIFLINTQKNKKGIVILLSLNIKNQEVKILEILDKNYFKDKEYLNGFDFGSVCSGYVPFEEDQTNEDVITFSLRFEKSNYEILFSTMVYDIPSRKFVYEGDYDEEALLPYREEKIEGKYKVKEGYNFIYASQVSLGEKEYIVSFEENGETWQFDNLTIFQDENSKVAREIYSDTTFNVFYHIHNGELYLEAKYEIPYGPYKHSDTVTLMFKANVEERTTTYLGYMPLYQNAIGVFEIN